MTKKLVKFLNSKEKNHFLNHLLEHGTISRAAEATGVTRQAHYLWMKDAKYREAYEKARTMAGDRLEEEAWRRAVDGVSRIVYYKGKKIGERIDYSDTLLAMLLKGAKPEIYGDKQDLTLSGSLTLDAADVIRAARERVAHGEDEAGKQ